MSTPATDEWDRQEMARLIAGQDPALNELMARHAEPLFRYLVRLLQNEAEAEDLAQETFVRVYQNRERFKPRGRFSTWLYAIATNLARDRLRWRARHPQVSLEAENEPTAACLADHLPSPQPTPADCLESRERVTAIRQAIAALPEDLRAPLVLAEYEELSHAEIAIILDCSPKAVEMRLYRARQQLRASLSGLLQMAS
jgi:RNA polymerase sigma-70 factor (ECF subfamily)